jgi:serine/threonine protein kinase
LCWWQSAAAPVVTQVKIGDFGFTKRLKRSKETIKVNRITHPRWVAPEVRLRYLRFCPTAVCCDMFAAVLHALALNSS